MISEGERSGAHSKTRPRNRRENSHSLKHVEYGEMGIFGWYLRLGGVCFDELVDTADGPSTREHSKDQTDEQDGRSDHCISIAAESSSAMWAGVVRGDIFVLHGVALACLAVGRRVLMDGGDGLRVIPLAQNRNMVRGRPVERSS